MKLFFTYYGGKWRAAPKYPKPQHGTIFEPFAGSAGYSVRYPDYDITLVELNPVVANLWKYLTRVSASEIRSLPLQVENVDDLDVCQEARWLIGFWLNKASVRPMKTPSKWTRQGIRPNSHWGEAIRERIATQVDQIRHWKVIEGSYDTAPNVVGTWFIDPPYQSAGWIYPHGSKAIDYQALAEWCRHRPGQTIVCEGAGASWLPFREFGVTKATSGIRGKGYSSEVIWTRDDQSDDYGLL